MRTFNSDRMTLSTLIRLHPNDNVLVAKTALALVQLPAGQKIAAVRIPAGRLMRNMVMQEVGGPRVTIEAGIKAVEDMLPIANACQHQQKTLAA